MMFNDAGVNDKLTWSEALVALKEGKHVARSEWVNRRQFLFLVKGEAFRKVIDRHIGPNSKKITDQIWINTSKKTIGPYTGNNCDIMANDWMIVLL